MLEDEAQRLKGQRQAWLIPHVALHEHIVLINASGCFRQTQQQPGGAVNIVALTSPLLTEWLTESYAAVALGHREGAIFPEEYDDFDHPVQALAAFGVALCRAFAHSK